MLKLTHKLQQAPKRQNLEELDRIEVTICISGNQIGDPTVRFRLIGILQLVRSNGQFTWGVHNAESPDNPHCEQYAIGDYNQQKMIIFRFKKQTSLSQNYLLFLNRPAGQFVFQVGTSNFVVQNLYY